MITIIDYGVGNIGSVANALSKLGKKFQITDDKEDLKSSDLLILPGVGTAGEGMKNLKKRNLDTLLVELIRSGKPTLGICLGMQLLFDTSEEANTKCLRVLKGKVIKFRKEKKIPQIGWNQVKIKQCNNVTTRLPAPKRSDGGQVKQLIKNIPDKSYFYFVNSYYCVPEDRSIIVGETTYGETFPSVIVKDNIVATQFHPEKSSKSGFELLNNIINCVSIIRIIDTKERIKIC